MIIHSTTLDTEAKVKAIYGSNTSWIQHSGYMLRGATSGVTANSATKTGGNDNAIVPYHRHSLAIQKSGAQQGTAYNSGYNQANVMIGGGTSYTNYEGSSGNATNANIPNYKSVYIWERIA